jgi:parallel beta-helix repeat protein
MSKLVVKLDGMQTILGKEIDDLRTRMEIAEMQGTTNSLTLKRHATLINEHTKKINAFEQFSSVKEEKKISYVFTAPPRNHYFAGRTDEIRKLKRILEVEETLNEKKVRVAAVCGLGGIGKTSLVSEYAHQMKDFYKGGVYWFSAEDDTHLSKTVNAVAVKIGALLNSFDLTLPNILKKISTIVHDPCLIVLDCLDQLDLSPNMMEFLSFPSKENFFGHFILLTRRNPKRLVNDVSVFEEKFCLQLECLQSEEAKQFLFSRTDVTRDQNENAESVAECLCEKLGRLPLALEQAGAYIQMLRCSLSSYLEQYETERLRLLNLQPARPISPGNESPDRLAVHTTWRINMEYIEKSTNGQAAVRFMNACSYFDENEIQKELVNVGTPEVEDVAYRKCVSSPLGSCQVLKLLTDFSLFTYVGAGCVTTHRLVQELVWENLDPKSKAESFIDAVRMLSYAFSKCPSPGKHVSSDEKNGEEQDIPFSDPPDSVSHFYMWSKLCMHGHHLRRNVEDLLVSLDSVCLDSVWFPETAKIIYECAVHLSADPYHQQEEAKRILNFAYRILDWLPLAGYETVEKSLSDNFFFPLPIPLPELFQSEIQRRCIPPFVSLDALTEKPASEADGLALEAGFTFEADVASEACDLSPEAGFACEASDIAPEVGFTSEAGFASVGADLAPGASNVAPWVSDLVPEAGDLDLEKNPDESELGGNKAFEQGCYEEALDPKQFNPLLLTRRPMLYIKLEQCEHALKYANEYITRRPYCWRGYALKSLALDGLNKEVSADQNDKASADLNDKASAEIEASLAFYYNRGIFADMPILVESFPDLQRRIFTCDSVDELLDAMFSQEVETDLLKILVLGSEEYILNNSETVDKPWNNCILVGTRKNFPFSLKSNYDISLLKCMLSNLSFCFNECGLHCLPDSFVKILNCNFTSFGDYAGDDDYYGYDYDDYDDSDDEYFYVGNNGGDDETIKTEGVFNAEKCSFTRIRLVCEKQSRAVLHDCSFCNNAKDGLRVEEGATLEMKKSRIYNNAGDGLMIDESVCVAVNCDIYGNGKNGVHLYHSDNVTLTGNNVYKNNMNGIHIVESQAHVRENRLYENNLWGIFAEQIPRSNISINNIFHNKTGGVHVEFEPKGEKYFPPVIELNKICNNGGPGLVVHYDIIKVEESNSPNSFQSAEFQNNEMHHNKENENDTKLNLSVPYCSHCRVKCKPTMCEKCFTTAYCSESCQKQHYSKHKEICKVLLEKSSYLITSVEEADKNDLNIDNPGEDDGSEEDNCSEEDNSPEEYVDQDGVGQKLVSLQRDDMRFVVKVHHAFALYLEGSFRMVLYNRNRQHSVTFHSKVIDRILKEFGKICRSLHKQKKLFFYCLFESPFEGQIRLFTNEFAEFQNW